MKNENKANSYQTFGYTATAHNKPKSGVKCDVITDGGRDLRTGGKK